ncbi:MAG TPA: helical backbone metal receptor, partial [Flavisolibacter sp.]|nr:helical backbone metal receptor [Flavisolibacter sp.]
MPLYTDQLERTLELKQIPKRIVSLVPSQTELLFDLGLNEEVVGITKFCVHPEHWFRTKTRIGGTKQLHLEKIKELQPDLIIANKEENVREQIEELANYFPVWISDVNNLNDTLEMIVSIGKLTNKSSQAKEMAAQINESFNQLQTPNSKLPTCYLIWNDPYMTIGGDTFINDMLQQSGFQNIFEDQKRYPEISIQQLQSVDCQLLLLSSEPYPFKQKHVDELQPLLPNTKIILVDGEMFSWYGSRLLK